MLIIGLVLSVFGLGFFCWLLFTLAIYALPFMVGLIAGLAAFHSGAGVIGALIVGVFAGGAALAIGQLAFAAIRVPLIRIALGLLYAIPAGMAGYSVTFGLSQIGVPSETWRVVFGVIGALFTGGTAWARMWLYFPPEAGQGVGAGSAYPPLTTATKDG
jgi:hypothetical protein